MVIPNICMLCRQNVESIDHIFIHYSIARAVQERFFDTFKVVWVMLESIEDLPLAWHGKDDLEASSFVYSTVPEVSHTPSCCQVLWQVYRSQDKTRPLFPRGKSFEAKSKLRREQEVEEKVTGLQKSNCGE